MPDAVDIDTPLDSDSDDLGPMSRPRRILASGAIVFVLYTAVLMACPWPAVQPKVQPFLAPALPLLDNLCLTHRLHLFAPTPPRWTGKLEFLVSFEDGTTAFYKYPRSVLAPGDPPDSYNRYLTTYIVWFHQRKTHTLVPALARYIARQSTTTSARPVAVDLQQRIVSIPPPELGIGQASPKPRRVHRLWHYDLASDKVVVTGQPILW